VMRPYRRARWPSQTSESAAITKSANAQKRTAGPVPRARKKMTGHAAMRATVMMFGRVKRLPGTGGQERDSTTSLLTQDSVSNTPFPSVAVPSKSGTPMGLIWALSSSMDRMLGMSRLLY